MNEQTLIAQELAKMGRGGDTMLAHINPQEAALLKMMGGSGTTNPYTGLPEYGFFKKLKRFIKKVAPVALIIIAVAAPQLIPQIGQAVLGGSASTVAATAAGAATIQGTATLASGGSIEDAAKNASIAALTSTVGMTASEATNTALVQNGVSGDIAKVASSTIGGAASGGTGAAVRGQDVGKGALLGGVTGGVTSGVTSALTPDVPAYDPSTAGDMRGFDYAGGMTPQQVAAANPDLYPGGQLPSAGQETVFAPGGDVYAQAATPISGRPTEFAKAAGKVAGQYAGQSLGSSLYDQQSAPSPTTSSRTLTSTGLFTPQSVVPGGITGIAPSPVATGRSISEGSEDEPTGAWGAKTLRG